MKEFLVALVLGAFSFSANGMLIDRGGGLVYDNTLDVTWLQNSTSNGISAQFGHRAWAHNLNFFDAVRNVTWTDWRLASNAEYVHMFNVNGVSTLNDGIFAPMAIQYWSGDECQTTFDGFDCHWFDFNTGTLFIADDRDFKFAWGVRNGDVGPAPVPVLPAVWLFGTR